MQNQERNNASTRGCYLVLVVCEFENIIFPLDLSILIYSVDHIATS